MKNLKGKTNAELAALKDAICEAPENRMPEGSFYLYTAAARRKLDAIDRAITHNLAIARAKAGNPVPTAGYSGRQTNRRR